MRRFDKELFRVFRETRLMEAYDDLQGCSVDKLSMMLYDLNEERLPALVDSMCRAVILKAIDRAVGREKALR